MGRMAGHGWAGCSKERAEVRAGKSVDGEKPQASAVHEGEEDEVRAQAGYRQVAGQGRRQAGLGAVDNRCQ